MGSRPARHRYCRCGTHLAKDNPSRQCARCARASRDKLIAAPHVPTEFWQTERQQARSLRDGVLDPTGTDESSLDLAAFLNGLATDCLPLLEHGEPSIVGVGVFEGKSIGERAEHLLKLFLQLNDELGGDVLYLPLSRYVAGLASVSSKSRLTVWPPLDNSAR